MFPVKVSPWCLPNSMAQDSVIQVPYGSAFLITHHQCADSSCEAELYQAVWVIISRSRRFPFIDLENSQIEPGGKAGNWPQIINASLASKTLINMCYITTKLLLPGTLRISSNAWRLWKDNWISKKRSQLSKGRHIASLTPILVVAVICGCYPEGLLINVSLHFLSRRCFIKTSPPHTHPIISL